MVWFGRRGGGSARPPIPLFYCNGISHTRMVQSSTVPARCRCGGRPLKPRQPGWPCASPDPTRPRSRPAPTLSLSLGCRCDADAACLPPPLTSFRSFSPAAFIEAFEGGARPSSSSATRSGAIACTRYWRVVRGAASRIGWLGLDTTACGFIALACVAIWTRWGEEIGRSIRLLRCAARCSPVEVVASCRGWGGAVVGLEVNAPSALYGACLPPITYRSPPTSPFLPKRLHLLTCMHLGGSFLSLSKLLHDAPARNPVSSWQMMTRRRSPLVPCTPLIKAPPHGHGSSVCIAHAYNMTSYNAVAVTTIQRPVR